MGKDFEEWKRQRAEEEEAVEEEEEEEEEEAPRSETAKEEEEEEEEVDDGYVDTYVGRFKIVERKEDRLKLVAGSRSSATTLNRTTIAIGLLLPIAIALAAEFAVGAIIPIAVLGTITIAVLLLFDFARAMTPGRIVKRSIEVVTPTLIPKEGYRDPGILRGAPELTIDGRRVEAKVADVGMRIELAGTSYFIMLDNDEIITLDTKANRMLPVLICRALNLRTSTSTEYLSGGGCFMTALVCSIELGIGLVGSGYIVTSLGSYSGWMRYGTHTAALVAAMFGLQRILGFAVRNFGERTRND